MKILYVAQCGLPNTAPGIRISEVGKILNSLGHRVTFLCRETNSKKELEYNGCKYLFDDKRFSNPIQNRIYHGWDSLFATSTLHRIHNELSKEKYDAVIIYNDSSGLTKKLLPLKDDYKLLADVTEWYSVGLFNSLYDNIYALNNNYFGVIKSFVNDNKDLIRSKDLYSGKNLLYLAIQQEKKRVYEYFITKIDYTTVINNSSILFRAIRSRNYELFMKLVNLGFSLETLDLKGNNVYHVLFSSFNKNVEQCTQIGNYLIEKKVPGYNNLNYDGWAPIHIAAKYSNYVCFEWIGYINKILESQKRELFDINILGKNNHTAFHLTCSAYKYSECMVLLNLGAELLLRGSDGKLPKNTTYNFFLTKMLFMREKELFYNKYIKNNLNNSLINININKKGIRSSKPKITATFDNCYDIKNESRLTFINSERSKSEVICNQDKFSLLEKYQILMAISLLNDKNEIIKIIKNIFKDLNFKLKQNFIIICELLGLIQNYNLYEFYQDLKDKKNDNEIKNLFMKRELNKVIIFLEKNKEKKIIKQKGRVLFDNNKINNVNKNNKTLKLNSFQYGNKFLNKTETDMNYYVINSNALKRKNNNESNKMFAAPGFQKLKEKKVQESITSIDFED